MPHLLRNLTTLLLYPCSPSPPPHLPPAPKPNGPICTQYSNRLYLRPFIMPPTTRRASRTAARSASIEAGEGGTQAEDQRASQEANLHTRNDTKKGSGGPEARASISTRVETQEHGRARRSTEGHGHDEMLAALHRSHSESEEPHHLTVEAFHSSDEASEVDTGEDSEQHGVEGDEGGEGESGTEHDVIVRDAYTPALSFTAAVTSPIFPPGLTVTAPTYTFPSASGTAGGILPTPTPVRYQPRALERLESFIDRKRTVRMTYKCAGFRTDRDFNSDMLREGCNEYIHIDLGGERQQAWRCKNCGSRAMYKLRTDRMVQFDAR